MSLPGSVIAFPASPADWYKFAGITERPVVSVGNAGQSFMVRRLYGLKRALVARLDGIREPRHWRFKHGIVVINHSLTDALEEAERLVQIRCV